MAWRTASRTQTGPGRKNRTCPGFPPVVSKALVRWVAILFEARQPRRKLLDGIEQRVGVHARKFLPGTRSPRDQDDPTAGRAGELGIDLHVADDDRGGWSRVGFGHQA